MNEPSLKDSALREAALFLACLLLGLLFLPIAIYLVGRSVFGDYGGVGFGGFYGDIHSHIRDGDPIVWFLVLSPYLIWQTLRWSWRLFRFVSRTE